jgi:hypothetical protein
MSKCGVEVEQAAGRGEVGFSGDSYVRLNVVLNPCCLAHITVQLFDSLIAARQLLISSWPHTKALLWMLSTEEFQKRQLFCYLGKIGEST